MPYYIAIDDNHIIEKVATDLEEGQYFIISTSYHETYGYLYSINLVCSIAIAI